MDISPITKVIAFAGFAASLGLSVILVLYLRREARSR